MKLRLLLHQEELQMEHQHYDLESVPMTWDPIDRNPVCSPWRSGLGLVVGRMD